ncbi:MAG TPA: hypothetical protein PLB65_08385 [Candidatus Cloacimonas sp.]|nr:hypothetical protein [Candidatus Cloacimonas sp.]
MIKNRLEKIEQKLDEGKPRVAAIFRIKYHDGTVVEHKQERKGYKGNPVVIECDEDDWRL